jgi:uncharacterized protein YfaT (DUF1175 family)
MSYVKFLKKYEKKGKYVVMVKSISKGNWHFSAGPYSYTDTADRAINNCNNKFQVSDCVLAMVGDRNVYDENKQDYLIHIAQYTCRKVGYTKGTEKFADCTIKMISQAQVQVQKQERSQSIIVGQRNSGRIYPLHCRQMGGASAC